MNGGQRTRRAAESVHQTHFLRFLRGDWDGFQNDMYVQGRKKHQKSIFREFTLRYHS